METVLREIFNSVKNEISETIAKESQGMVIAPSGFELMQTGESSFQFYLDADGKCRAEVEERGYGVTISCSVWLEVPDAIYSLKITSSAGTNEEWHNVRVNQHLSFMLRTEGGFAKTKVIVGGSSSITNANGSGKIAYSY